MGHTVNSAAVDLLVVGTGRCGSTLLAELLAEHPSRPLVLSEFFTGLHPHPAWTTALSGSEYAELLLSPRPLLTFLLKHHLEPPEVRYRFHDGSRFTRQSGVPPIAAATLPLLTDDPDAFVDPLRDWAQQLRAAPVSELHRRLFAWLAARFDRNHIIERSGGSLASLVDLRREYPSARVLHLYRDGPACAASMSRHPLYRLTAIGRNFERAGLSNPYTDMDRIEDPPDLPDHLHGLHPSAFDACRFVDAELDVRDFALGWSLMMRRAASVFRDMPRRQLIHVRYEDLAQRDTLEEIGDFCDARAGREAVRRWAERASSAVAIRPQTTEPPQSVERACALGRRALAQMVSAERFRA